MKEKNKNKKETVEVELTPEERDQILEDLVFKGETYYENKILNGKLKIKLKSLSASEQIEIDKRVSKVEGSNLEFWHNYAVITLAYALVTFDKDDLSKGTVEERLDFIKSKSAMLIDKIIEENGKFNNKVKAAMSGENVKETFFETPSTSSE